MTINPETDAYVLEGKLVTMGPQGIIEDGAIYIRRGVIEEVQSADLPPPPGFENAPSVRTGDTIYPGLIELHNHLSYNAMPLWDVPKKYTNNGQWRGAEGYRRDITKPSQVLGGTEGVVEALVRYVEMRALLGGVTTSQGISLSSEPGIKRFYKGLVRNVEKPVDPNLPAAGTKIGNPTTGKAEAYFKTLKKKKCYLQHLSEGTDEIARGWFHRLKMDNGEWAINDAFCGIHSTALNEQDFQVIVDHGGTMVWSPLSNYLLYGQTTDLNAVKNSGIKIGLGSDWAPSGSKNLLGELKVAWLASEEQGSVFSAEELVAMVTSDAAQIASWHDHLGTIEKGKRADLVAVNGQKGDAYMRLINARETSITLVLIDGIPRVGQNRLMDDFGEGTETIQIGRSTRVLNLQQVDADPVVGQLTLEDAISRLDYAMKNLPLLAEHLDTALSTGFASGSLDDSGVRWRIAFDMEDDDAEIELALGIGARPLSYYVTESKTLEAITVVDDKTHLKNLVAARNLPDFVKKGLPRMYGERIPIPDSGQFLQDTDEDLATEVLTSLQDLATFMRSSGELTLADRKRIVQQAKLLLEENYVHLPLKQAMHAVNPVQALRLLAQQLNETTESSMGSEIQFHNKLTRIFNSLRDLHTSYWLPVPFRGKTAWLPFLIEQIQEQGETKYIVSKLLANAGPESFTVGVTITHWNGMPIEQVINNNAERYAGSNEAARFARGLNALTLRPLASGIAPQEDWVRLRFIGLNEDTHEWQQNWLVFEPRSRFNRIPSDSKSSEACAVGMDNTTDIIQHTKKVLYAPAVADAETSPMLSQSDSTPQQANSIESLIPGIFKASKISHGRKQYAYIRIFSFNINDAEVFVNEFVRLLNLLPKNGLIIDVRGNGGGLIYAAEQLLQVLTPETIEPEKAQFINSATNLTLCRNHSHSSLFPGLILNEWIESIKQSVTTGATYSLGFPISKPEDCNKLGQQYFGPVALIVDPLCYSATDIFAAGFKDHDIGPIIGTADNTGAGGANVWSHPLISLLMQPDQLSELESPYKPLPKLANMRVAVRRTIRVKRNAGEVIEDIGIQPDIIHHMTRKDVLENNQDLMRTAIESIENKPSYTLDIKFETASNRLPELHIKCEKIQRIDITVGKIQLKSIFPTGEMISIDLHEELQNYSGDNQQATIRAYIGDRLVAKRLINLSDEFVASYRRTEKSTEPHD